MVGLQHLRALAIGGGNEVGAGGCKTLAAMKNLQSLTIGYFNDVGPEGCQALAESEKFTFCWAASAAKKADLIQA